MSGPLYSARHGRHARRGTRRANRRAARRGQGGGWLRCGQPPPDCRALSRAPARRPRPTPGPARRLRAGERGLGRHRSDRRAPVGRRTPPPRPPRPAPRKAGGGRSGPTLDTLADAVGRQESELNRLDAALKSLERTWLFLGREDATLIGDMGPVVSTTEMNMRIVEAQESERLRIVREVHDGPAQALSNAIFQIDYVGRVDGR